MFWVERIGIALPDLSSHQLRRIAHEAHRRNRMSRVLFGRDNLHHLVPQSRCQTRVWREMPSNHKYVDRMVHACFHWLFENMMPHEQLMLVAHAPKLDRYSLIDLQFRANWECEAYRFALGEDPDFGVREHIVQSCAHRLDFAMERWTPVFGSATLPHEVIRQLAVAWTPEDYYEYLTMTYRLGEEEVTLRLY